jgi:hypothetical protein
MELSHSLTLKREVFLSTRALDLTTVLHALATLEKGLQSTTWQVHNKQQAQVVMWLLSLWERLESISGLKAKASKSYQELNRFLLENGFDPSVEPFDPNGGLGVVSILDKLVRWLYGPGELVTIHSQCRDLPGFKIPEGGVNIYEVDGYQDSRGLVELRTKSDDTLWLFLHSDQTLDGLDLVKLSFDVMSKERTRNKSVAGVHVPMVDFDIQPDISWLCGMSTNGKDGGFSIVQAKQQFKMRMDQTGARVKVATSMVAFRCMLSSVGPLIIDRPFYGWWTQKGCDFPMAAFFADWDSLKKPEGSLEDL